MLALKYGLVLSVLLNIDKTTDMNVPVQNYAVMHQYKLVSKQPVSIYQPKLVC